MSVAMVLSREQRGIDAPQVRVEVDIDPGLPAFNIVGRPEAAVKESKDRVRAALTNSKFEFPSGRITVNRSPADLPMQQKIERLTRLPKAKQKIVMEMVDDVLSHANR